MGVVRVRASWLHEHNQHHLLHSTFRLQLTRPQTRLLLARRIVRYALVANVGPSVVYP